MTETGQLPDVRYTPGSWVAVVGNRVWLLAEVDRAEPVIQRWWELVRGGRGIDELLGAIVHEGFRTVGNFAIVQRSHGIERVVVRGRAGVEVRSSSGDTKQVAAAEVATWLDTSVDEALAGLRLMAGDYERDAPGSLPVSEGVVLASMIMVSFESMAELPVPQVVREPDETPVVVEPAPPEPADEPPEQGFDHLFGATQQAKAEPEPAPAPLNRPVTIGADTLPVAAVEDAGIIVDLPWALAQQPAAAPVQPTRAARADIAMTVKRQPQPSADAAAPTVFAIRCPAGHLNPEDGRTCRVCGVSVAEQQPLVAPRPVLGALRLSTGDTIALDRGVIMGREPQPPDGDDRAWHRVKLPSPGNDISRNHVEVRLGDWQVFVCDLGSTNGTEVTVPGMVSRPLQPNEPIAIEPGTVVNLAREISFTFEVIG